MWEIQSKQLRSMSILEISMRVKYWIRPLNLFNIRPSKVHPFLSPAFSSSYVLLIPSSFSALPYTRSHSNILLFFSPPQHSFSIKSSYLSALPNTRSQLNPPTFQRSLTLTLTPILPPTYFLFQPLSTPP